MAADVARISAEIRLPEPTARTLGESTRSALAAYGRSISAAQTIRQFIDVDTVAARTVFRAAREAAAVANAAGDPETARKLTGVTDEVAELVQNPSLENLEKAVADIERRLQEDAESRDRKDSDNVVFSFYLWYLAIIAAFVMWYFPRKAP
jgi:hypothetical protein